MDRPKNTIPLKFYILKSFFKRYYIRKYKDIDWDNCISYALVEPDLDIRMSSFFDSNVLRNKCEEQIVKSIISMYLEIYNLHQNNSDEDPRFNFDYLNNLSDYKDKIRIKINHFRQKYWYWGPLFNNEYYYK